MKELDKKITEALRTEDAELFRDIGDEPGVFEMLLKTFRGKRRWLNILGAIWTLIFLVLGIASATAFFRAEATRDLVMWATACIMCTAAVALLKTWYWMEMQRIVVMREIKRVELQIARLATRLRD
jgi:hypothetical protein